MGWFDSAASSIAGSGLGAAAGAIGLNPATARLAVAGLVPGGSIGLKMFGAKVNLNLGGGTPDWRVRVSLADSANYFYHAQNSADRGLMAPLFGGEYQNGVIFPYTPQVQVTHTANYAQQKFTHSNQPGYYYENSEVAAITISGDFTVQNITEGQYLMAAITFFRAATKMWFGSSNNKDMTGFPPPMVFLNGYGAHYLPNVPCVITSFSHTMPSDCDYIEVPMASPTSGGANGVGGAVQQGIDGLLNGGGMGAVQDALSSGINSVIGSAAGPSGSGLSQLLNQATGGAFGSGPPTRLPTVSQLSVTLQPVYSRAKMSGFNLDEFAAGKLINKGFI